MHTVKCLYAWYVALYLLVVAPSLWTIIPQIKINPHLIIIVKGSYNMVLSVGLGTPDYGTNDVACLNVCHCHGREGRV